MRFSDFVRSRSEIKMGFLGGSITEGSGAGKPEFCYRERVAAELNKKYTGTSFAVINAGIGGTGSDLGLFRMDNDMLQYEPDMVFIEFAVNDFQFAKTDVYVENIVRRILKKNPDTKIVFIYTAQITMCNEFYAKGKLPESVEKQQKIADYYGIPTVNAGKELFEKYVSEGRTLRDYTVDNVHPNDEGYAVYTEKIMADLENMEFGIVLKEKPLTVEISNPAAIRADSFAHDGWQTGETWLFRKCSPCWIESSVPGTKFSFDFEGSVVGLYFMRSGDSGVFEYVIDGEIYGKCDTWDKYCLEFNRSNYQILNDTLEYGKHTVEITVLPEKAKLSKGTVVRIGAVLVG